MRLFGRWYLVRDTGRPVDYPPRARDELISLRLENHDLKLIGRTVPAESDKPDGR